VYLLERFRRFAHIGVNHYTWKLWCLNDAPALDILWLDAGLVVLDNLDEVFTWLDVVGYFLCPNYEPLEREASESASDACGVSWQQRRGKPSLAANVMGFRRRGVIETVLKEALSVASVEVHIAATRVTHRHDQAILGLLLHKNIPHLLVSDGTVYAGWLSPAQVPGQKLWAHRRRLSAADMSHYVAHVSTGGVPHVPMAPHLGVATARSALFHAVAAFESGDLLRAATYIATTLSMHPSWRRVPFAFADHVLRRATPLGGPAIVGGFVAWTIDVLGDLNDSYDTRGLRAALRMRVAAHCIRRGEARSAARHIMASVAADPLLPLRALRAACRASWRRGPVRIRTNGHANTGLCI